MATIEAAKPVHVAGVARLYAREAQEGFATFDVEGLPEPVWEQRRCSTSPGDALLVALDTDDGTDSAVVGFAWSHAYRPKPAYASTRETTVYVEPAASGRGVGGALYAALLERVSAAGVHLVVAGIAEPNPASTRMHQRAGFTEVGTMREVGHKLGHYRDVTWWQRRLA